MKKGILALIFILVVGVSAFFIFTKKASTPAPELAANNNQSVSNDSSSQQQTPSSEASTAVIAATVVYTDNGFSPKTFTVKTGSVIEVKNQSSHSLQFSSDPHPSHTGNKELNQSTISANGSQTFTVTKKGTFGFHDHLDNTKTGSLTVE